MGDPCDLSLDTLADRGILLCCEALSELHETAALRPAVKGAAIGVARFAPPAYQWDVVDALEQFGATVRQILRAGGVAFGQRA